MTISQRYFLQISMPDSDIAVLNAHTRKTHFQMSVGGVKNSSVVIQVE